MVKKIYLEVDEEITSVIEKLESVEEAEVALVFPKESGILQSIVNLKLIKREAEKLGKEISVITSNKVGRTLAEQIGLRASDHIETRKEPFPVKKQDAKDKVPIEFRKTPKEMPEEEEEIGFKKESIDKDEVSVKEDEEIGTARVERGSGDRGEGGSQNGEGSREDKEKLGVKTDEDEVLGKRFKLKVPLKSFGTFVSLTIIGLFVFGYVYIPRVEVTIAVSSEKKDFETDITIDKNEKDSNFESGVITAEIVDFTKEDSKKFDATGKKDAGTKATGTITASNKYDSSVQTFVAGTRFSANNLIFKTTQNVNIPGATVEGGQLKAGTVNVTVEAENPGANYNIGPSHFTIPAFVGTPKDGLIYGDSTSSMSGGTSKEVTYVTSSDVSKAKDEFSKEVVEAAKKEAKEKAGKGNVLRDEALKVEVVEAEPSPGVNSEANQFSLKVKVQAEGVSYKEDDLKKAYEKKAEAEGGGMKQLVESGYDDAKVTAGKVDFENGTYTLSFESNIYLSSILDQNMIRDEITGQTKAKSEDFIKSLEGVKGVEFRFWPAFIKRIPRLKSHVKIKAEVSEVEKEEEGVTESG